MDQRSPEARSYRRLYSTSRWKNLRAAHLRSEPLCRMCKEGGKLTPATVVDHVEPHRGDEALFWSGPHQSLCSAHHSGAKQRIERGTRAYGVDKDGWPLSAESAGVRPKSFRIKVGPTRRANAKPGLTTNANAGREMAEAKTIRPWVCRECNRRKSNGPGGQLRLIA